ncbi:molybdopterin-dependent oxidoreductase [Bradyrhizobium sp. Mp27]|nr:molybdopterin cofactor-binding domain-containing protein [Bradyrhizobium sp. Mp27]MDI2068982.1 molybdopterin-dependent oxidoreductase [Bradyrhizobium sp. Mp27]
MKAVDAVTCEWAPSAYPAEQAEHWKVLESSFKPEFLGKEWRKIGDIEAGLKTGKLVEAEYRAPYLGHQPLEPLNGIGLVTDKGMEIWVGHQSPRFVQYVAATAIGLSRNRSPSTISGRVEALATVSSTRTSAFSPRSPIR